MTNKEAIKILQEQQAKFNDEYIDYGGVNEAYDLAIKALEERPQGKWITCNSLTSDNELLDENEYYMCPFCHSQFRRKHDFCVCGADMRGKKNDK